VSDCCSVAVIYNGLLGAEDPLSTRRVWEEAQAEKKRLNCNNCTRSVGCRLPHMARVAQLVEREQRAFSKFDAMGAAQQAQSRRISDLIKQMVHV
jgi:hypothetical protein